MGVYASYSKSGETVDPRTGERTWTEHRHWPGHTDSRTVTATAWVETERTDCYCCSCDEDPEYGTITHDPYCRNHGFAGERACETHGMPGSGTHPETGEPLVLESVQAVHARQRARYEARNR